MLKLIYIIYNITIWIISIFISCCITDTFIRLFSIKSYYIYITIILISIVISFTVSTSIFKLGIRLAERKLNKKGFIADDAFQSRYVKFWIDIQTGRIAILKKLFPLYLHIIPASEINECSIEMDRGNYTGRVGMKLNIGNQLIKCNTFFCSGERVFVNSDPVIRGVELAKYFIALLYEAKSNSGGDSI